MRLRAGKAGSAKGAGRMVAQAISTASAAGASGPVPVRGDSADGSRAVITACVRHGAQFSLVMTRNPAAERALAAIDENAWTPVSNPGAGQDPDTGARISDAEVAEIPYTAFASTTDTITARLIARRDRPQRIHPAAQDHQRSRPTDPTPTPTGPASTHPLALVAGLACTVAQHHRLQPASGRDSLTIRRQGPTGTHRKAGQTSRYPVPTRRPIKIDELTPNRHGSSVDPG
jgi:hypothetical protein